jgi:hypothetical protein
MQKPVAKLIYSTIMSLDGYVADRAGSIPDLYVNGWHRGTTGARTGGRAVRDVCGKERRIMDAVIPLGPLLRAFFAEHLVQQKAASPQTVSTYRDAFCRLLDFLQQGLAR